MGCDGELILAFDTSAAHCAAALVCGAQVLGKTRDAMQKGQAERLMPMLEEVLDGAGKTWRDIDRIAVCTGPGSFTGVRIAVAAARGLALALEVPAVGVSAFEALAFGRSGAVTVVLDARRGRVYRQEFRDSVAVDDPQQVALADVTEPARYLGYMADDLAVRNGGTCLATGTPVDPVAVARCSMRGARGRPAPLYLRAADAALPADPPPVILP